ncbi:MAG: hypothetical protein HZB38_17715 [Planctomycetes bacterium]|nr:hypothetical protein [Planctomycetota bacterium]
MAASFGSQSFVRILRRLARIMLANGRAHGTLREAGNMTGVISTRLRGELSKHFNED